MKTLSDETLRALQAIDSCTISNAIEQFGVRTRNEGFVNGSVRCLSPQLGPRVGYAATATIRTSSTPVVGRCYYERADWWAYVHSLPSPQFLVVEDMDHMPGVGALFGEIHANIAAALGCSAYMTNGSVRDLSGVTARGLQLFAGSVAVSHSYAHVVEFGQPVEIGALQIKPGDLLHGDQHGVVCIPLPIADQLPEMAARLLRVEQELIGFCQSRDFSFDGLVSRLENAAEKSCVLERDTNHDS